MAQVDQRSRSIGQRHQARSAHGAPRPRAARVPSMRSAPPLPLVRSALPQPCLDQRDRALGHRRCRPATTAGRRPWSRPAAAAPASSRCRAGSATAALQVAPMPPAASLGERERKAAVDARAAHSRSSNAPAFDALALRPCRPARRTDAARFVRSGQLHRSSQIQSLGDDAAQDLARAAAQRERRRAPAWCSACACSQRRAGLRPCRRTDRARCRAWPARPARPGPSPARPAARGSRRAPACRPRRATSGAAWRSAPPRGRAPPHARCVVRHRPRRASRAAAACCSGSARARCARTRARRRTCFQPSPSVPIRWSCGTTTSSNMTSLKSCSSSRLRIGRTVMPGVFMSTRNCDRPACRFVAAVAGAHQHDHVVRMVRARGPHLAAVDHPAVGRRGPPVRIDARSEPESGSLMPMQKNASPRTIRGT